MKYLYLPSAVCRLWRATSGGSAAAGRCCGSSQGQEGGAHRLNGRCARRAAHQDQPDRAQHLLLTYTDTHLTTCPLRSADQPAVCRRPALPWCRASQSNQRPRIRSALQHFSAALRSCRPARRPHFLSLVPNVSFSRACYCTVLIGECCDSLNKQR